MIDCVNSAGNCAFPGIFTGWQTGDPPPKCGQAYPAQAGQGSSFCQTNCGCCTPTQTYINGRGCVAPATPPPTPVPAPSCIVTIAAGANPMQVGTTTTVRAAVSPTNGLVSTVNFTSTGSVTIDPPTSDSSISYQALIRSQSAGSATVRAGVIISGIERCFGITNITVNNTQAWWQVKDGDVTAETGDIRSDVPLAQLFNTNGTGGFPGVPVYEGDSEFVKFPLFRYII